MVEEFPSNSILRISTLYFRILWTRSLVRIVVASFHIWEKLYFVTPSDRGMCGRPFVFLMILGQQFCHTSQHHHFTSVAFPPQSVGIKLDWTLEGWCFILLQHYSAWWLCFRITGSTLECVVLVTQYFTPWCHVVTSARWIVSVTTRRDSEGRRQAEPD